MSTPIDLDTVGCSEYTIAGMLLAQFVAALAETRAGAPAVAVIHPGDMVPGYGCDLVTARITQVVPAPGMRQPRCETVYAVTVELAVTRCYATPKDNAMPAVAVLDSAARDSMEDAAAARAAVAALRELTGLPTQWVSWRPSGPRGGLHSGVCTVTVTTDLGVMAIDEMVAPIPGDPRNR